ncbi:Pol Polyprotein [Phytophthora megakarya]|uniref:Pol Polyprotein n=1 Tax=Phytophthora megakarya TaxID=4795 RepID=A0A225VTM3_9STRA|nr:Pol Polyprotein [Phytophthora megakarya]
MLSQRQTILEVLERFGLADANAVRVPIVDGQDDDCHGVLLPGGANGTPSRPTIQLFQSLVGSLLWLARSTRPDIAFAVHRVTRRAHAPCESDWRNAKRILRYLKGTIDMKSRMEIGYGVKHAGEVNLEGYSDADYAADRVDRKSVSGGVLSWMALS